MTESSTEQPLGKKGRFFTALAAAAAAGLAAAFAPRSSYFNRLGSGGASLKPYPAYRDQSEDEKADASSKLKWRSRIGLPAIGRYGAKYSSR